MDKMRVNMTEFRSIGGGFGMVEKNMRDRKLMQPVCEMIRKYAGFYNELLAAFR
jgi:hypothetical protein